MREIKFRGYQLKGKNKTWVFGSYDWNWEALGKSYIYTLIDRVIGGHLVDKESIGQYTGLKDKNGVEIYEGDILKYVYHPLGNDELVYEYSKTGVIEYQFNCFGFVAKIEENKRLIPERCMSWQRDERKIYKHPTKGLDWFNANPSFYKMEVIGNIYENPELLK